MGKKNHKNAPYLCGQCKQGFRNADAVRMHIRDAHPTIHNCGVYHCIDGVDGKDYEPSYGERTAEAQMQEMLGEPVSEPWLLGK